MSSSELEHLIKMINQIADNLATEEGDDARARLLASHVKKFWAPSMINTISQYAENEGEKLQPVALIALRLLNA